MCSAHHFGSVQSCVSWYSAASMTYLPLDTPCWGSVLAGTATLLVSIPHGYRAPCSYCICDSLSVSYSCFICGSYFTCNSCYAPCSCCTPYPILIAWLCTPGPRMSPVTVFVPGMLGMFPDGGIIGISLWRGSGSFMLFSIKRGGLSLGYCLVKMLLALAVLVLTVANGSGIRATVCTGILFATLACLAWSSISHRSGSLS